MTDRDNALSPGRCALLACTAEVMAPKAGNVHPEASFDDVSCGDFLASALAIAPVLDRAEELGVGGASLGAVQATRAAAGSNTNLGMILLLAPLACASGAASLRAGVREVLLNLTDEDARLVYEAIALAQPGGLGTVKQADVSQPPSVGLVEAMRLAADRDMIARQYAADFADVFDKAAAWLAEAYHGDGLPLDVAIVKAHLRLMAAEPDSLILRKCGQEIARESMHRAGDVLAAGYPDREVSLSKFEAFDAWLRQGGHVRNPGTSADLICGGLYALIMEARLEQPWRWRGSVLPLAGDWLMESF